MIRDITIGQFFPGESLLPRADPRMKIILSILYIVVIFMTNSLSGYIFLVLFTAALAIISRISFTVLLKAVKPLWFIILFTAVINIFWNKDGTLLVSFWKIEIFRGALECAFYDAANSIAPHRNERDTDIHDITDSIDRCHRAPAFAAQGDKGACA